MRNVTAGLVALALLLVSVEARAEDPRWVLAGDGTWIQEPAAAPAAAPSTAAPVEVPAAAGGAWSPPEARVPAAVTRSKQVSRDENGDGDERDDDDAPMRSGWGFAGGVVLTSVGGSLLAGAALASLPIGYEGNGGGDPGVGVATVAILGAAAIGGGIGLILWARAPASGGSTALVVGPASMRVDGTF